MHESLLAPGPVNLHPEVRRILSLPMIHHRTPEFDKIFARALEGLQWLFGTRERVYILTSTGSGGMEALIVNTLSPGDEVLAIVSGKFGERWGEMAAHYGGQVTTLEVPWGEAVDPADVEAHLAAHPKTRLVLCQACETSTAVKHPIEAIARLTRARPETLLLVDGITAVGAYPLPMDDLGIDGLVAGSQKAFMLPTGLSFVSFSAKAWNFVERARTPRYYFDIRRERKANEKGESAFSSVVPTIRALDWVLSDIRAQGLRAHYHTIERRARMTRDFAALAGFPLYSQSSSESVTALTMPKGIDGQKVRQRLEDEHKITIIGGQDQAKGKILRIGHMGYIQDDEMLRLFDCLGKVMIEVGAPDWTLEKVDDLHRRLRDWAGAHA